MKAQILKTFYTVRGSLCSVLFIVVLWSLIPQGFLNVFAVIYGATLPFSLLTLDQRSRWDRYARMLPYRDRDVVLNYYFIGWFVMALGAVLVAASRTFWGAASSVPVKAIPVALGVGCFLLAVNVPLMLRFGTEKGRMVSMITIFLCCGSAGALQIFSLEDLPENAAAAADLAQVMDVAVPASLALGLVSTALSIPLSVKFYRRDASL